MDYNYSERISHNEQRIAELKGKLVADKLSIQALEKENERCFEAMNNCTSVIDTEKTKKDKQILELTQTIEDLKIKNKKLRKEKSQLKTELDYTKQKLEKEIRHLQSKLLRLNDDRDDVILADNFGKDNVFEQRIGGK